jgi:hypothetical protein
MAAVLSAVKETIVPARLPAAAARALGPLRAARNARGETRSPVIAAVPAVGGGGVPGAEGVGPGIVTATLEGAVSAASPVGEPIATA